jgi:hypothetical protein
VNLQPNAVRELSDLGITRADLDRVGLPACSGDRLEMTGLMTALHHSI